MCIICVCFPKSEEKVNKWKKCEKQNKLQFFYNDSEGIFAKSE